MQQYNGKGYMAEAVEAIIEFARINMEVNKIIAIVYIENSNCKRLLEKFGFIKVGKEESIFRGSMYLHGIFNLDEFEAPPFFAPNDDATYKKLLQVHPPLAETYREVGQAFHGTTADPARAAISCMRQTVRDHFFENLAPEDAVRSSPYWKPKTGNDPLQITRRERMTYATHAHIKIQNEQKLYLIALMLFSLNTKTCNIFTKGVLFLKNKLINL